MWHLEREFARFFGALFACLSALVDMGLELRYVQKHEHWLHRFRVSGVLLHVAPALCVSGFSTQSVFLKAANQQC